MKNKKDYQALAIVGFVILSIFTLHLMTKHSKAKLREELEFLEIQQVANKFDANLVQIRTSEEHIYKIVPMPETMAMINRWKERAELGEIDWPEATEPLDLLKLYEQYLAIQEKKQNDEFKRTLKYIESGYN